VYVSFVSASSFSTKVKFVHKLVNNYIRTLHIEYSLLIIIEQRTGWNHTYVANVNRTFQKNSTRHSASENSIVTPMYSIHVTRVANGTYRTAAESQWIWKIVSGRRKNRNVKPVQLGRDRFLHVGVCCKLFASQMLFEGSKEMHICWGWDWDCMLIHNPPPPPHL
jgi:hypothetical protein